MCMDYKDYERELRWVYLSQFLAEVGVVAKDFIVPIFFRMKNQLIEGGRQCDHFIAWQYLLPEYDGYYLSQDYLELIFPMVFVFVFGSISRFVTAATWLFLAWSQRPVDCWRLLHLYRRTSPVQDCTIGETRTSFMFAVSYVTIFVNGMFIVLRDRSFSAWTLQARIALLFAGVLVVQQLRRFVFYFIGEDQRVKLLMDQGRWQREVVHSHHWNSAVHKIGRSSTLLKVSDSEAPNHVASLAAPIHKFGLGLTLRSPGAAPKDGSLRSGVPDLVKVSELNRGDLFWAPPG